MTTPILEYRGLDLLSALTDPSREGIRITIVSGFLTPPEVRGGDYVVAARAGRQSGNRVDDVLKIVANGRIQAATATTWRALTDDLLAVLAEGGQEPGDLIARGPYRGMDVGETATIAARVKNYIEGPLRAGELMQTWSIEFESIDPVWVRS